MVKSKDQDKEKQLAEAAVVAEAAPAPAKQAKEEQEPKATAKAGKRSAKVLAEVEEKQAKEERKTKKAEAETAQPKTSKKPTRTKLERSSKKYREAAKLIEKDKIYTLSEALDLATKTGTTKFDSTVELHINLGVDPRQADQNVRGTVTLPEGTGKTARIAVLADADGDKSAKAAGADIVGADHILANLEKEKIDFDVLIATPAMMSKLAKYARLLGPKGLMPNPKSGTVSADVTTAVTESKAGRLEYRVDSAGIIHLGIGKASFGADKLSKNAQVIVEAIRSAKPASLKGQYIKSAHVSTTMGPGIKTQIYLSRLSHM